MATKSKARPTPTRQRTERVPAPPSWTGPVARGTVLAAVLGTTLLLLTSSNDTYVVPKLVVLGLCAVAAIGVYAWSLAESGTLRLVRTPVLLGAGVVCALMTLATLVNGARLRSFFGDYGRDVGLLAYLAAAVLLFVVTVEFDQRDVRRLVRFGCWVAGGVVLYGLLQKLGAEPLGAPSTGQVISTLGQVNFMAGFSGMALPLFLFVAVSPDEATHWRVAAGAAAVAAVVVGLSTSSFQAFLSLGVGGGVFALLYVRSRWGTRTLAMAAGVVVVGLALTGAVAHSRIDAEVRSSMSERVLMWQAAGDMISDHPVLGTGPQGYAANFTAYRPPAHSKNFGVFQIVDNPHSVPISMFVDGGVPLGLAYLAFVGLVGWSLIAGLRRTTGDRALLLAAVGAAWLAYQAQSLVSIDMPTFVVWHFVLAGAIGVLSVGAEARTVVVRALVGRPRRAGRMVTPVGRGVQVGVAAFVLVAVFLLSRLVIADVAYAHGLQSMADDDPAAAVDELDHATSLVPWYGIYWAGYASALARSGDQDAALVAGAHSARQSPSAASWALSTAQLAQRMGNTALADTWFRYAVAHSPDQPEVLNARGEFLVAEHRPQDALPLYRLAVARRPDNPTYLGKLGEVLELLGKKDEARGYYQRALAIKADEPNAVAGLQRLG
jgi:tetratricopeptide (TPR) repeat protein